MAKTKDQYRAAAAWQQIESVPAGDVLKDYESLVKSAPALIQTCGLGQTVAFYLSKGKPHHRKLLEHLARWLLRNETLADQQPDDSKQPNDLIKAVQEQSADAYRQMAQEAMAYLVWLKRFAAARKLAQAQSAGQEAAADTPEGDVDDAAAA